MRIFNIIITTKENQRARELEAFQRGLDACKKLEDDSTLATIIPLIHSLQKQSQDDLNQPETHSTDVLIEAISKLETTTNELERTKKQLEIAVEALKTIEKKSDKFDDSWGVQEQLDYIKAEAQSVLYKLKELEK